MDEDKVEKIVKEILEECGTDCSPSFYIKQGIKKAQKEFLIGMIRDIKLEALKELKETN